MDNIKKNIIVLFYSKVHPLYKAWVPLNVEGYIKE